MKKAIPLILSGMLLISGISFALAPPSLSGTDHPGTSEGRGNVRGAAEVLYEMRNDESPLFRALKDTERRYSGDERFHARQAAKRASPVVRDYIRRPVPLKLRGALKNYPWGDPRHIPSLLGFENPEGKAYAEMWIGAHPGGPSTTDVNNTRTDLPEILSGAAEEILGESASEMFGAKLPYLFKVLAAETALSIQAHPDKRQAEEGWAREGGQGPNYKDDNHKPEIICAVTRFWALNGFRPAEDIASSLELLDIQEFTDDLARFKEAIAGADEGAVAEALRELYSAVMERVARLKKAEAEKNTAAISSIQDEISAIVGHVVRKSRQRISSALGIPEDAVFEEILKEAKERGKEMELRRELWALRLNGLYENDMGVLSTYLLNLVRLEPGEAMYLPAGELHAYLGKLDPDAADEGLGIELMANSDNVLRGGLTPKHVDVPELLRVLTFNSGEPEILSPERSCRAERVYRTGADEFELSVVDVTRDLAFASRMHRSADTFLVLEGEVELLDGNGHMLTAKKGKAFIVPASSGRYTIRAVTETAKLYKAGIPSRVIRSYEKEEGHQLEFDQKTRVWAAADRVFSRGVMVILPQSVMLTDDIKKALAENRRKHGDKIEVVRVKPEDIGIELASSAGAADRIIIADGAMSSAISAMISDDGRTDLFRDVKVLRMNLPAGPVGEDQMTTYQARMLMIAFIARVAGEDTADAQMLKALLEEMLEGCFHATDVSTKDFVALITRKEDETARAGDIRDRVLYFLAETRAISLVRQLQREFLRIREFWKYA